MLAEGGTEAKDLRKTGISLIRYGTFKMGALRAKSRSESQ